MLKLKRNEWPAYKKLSVKKGYISLLCFFLLITIGENTLWARKAKSNQTSLVYDQKYHMRVGFENNQVLVEVKPNNGEGAYRLGKRVLKDWNNRFNNLIQYNNNQPLKIHRYVPVPFKELNSSLQKVAVQGLFPNDITSEKGWVHQVQYRGETLSFIAGVFTKQNISTEKLIRYNRLKRKGRSLGVGDKIVIPWRWLRSELESDPISVRPPLKIRRNKQGKKFAYYRLKENETLYSAVVIRFTGRTYAKEVNRMAKKLLALNNIKNPKGIRSNTEIKILLEWLSEEYVVNNKIKAPSKKKISQKLKPSKKKQNYASYNKRKPIHVILDAGHGGRNPGAVAGSYTNHDKVYEDELVYDIVLRMKEKLEDRGYIVYLTVRDKNHSKPQNRLSMKNDDDEYLLVNPPYNLRKSEYGVNLRVFLINHIYQKLRAKRVPKENILFMSIHGDALHSSLRGTMIYYPDQRLRMSHFRKEGPVYRRRREFSLRINFTGKENEAIAQSSRNFGQTIVDTFRRARMRMPKTPLRSYNYSDGKRSLPAVLRYSKVPTSVLVEVANLKNKYDRREILKSKNRQKMANQLVQSIQNYYNRRRSQQVASL